MQKEIFVTDGCGMAPHNVSQTDWWSHIRGEIQVICGFLLGLVSNTMVPSRDALFFEKVYPMMPIIHQRIKHP
jgi:hypothetical protein